MPNWAAQLFLFLLRVRARFGLPTPVAQGEVVDAMADRYGRLAFVGPQPSARYVAQELANHELIVAHPGQLLELTAFNDTDDDRYLLLIENASLDAPTLHSAPIERFLFKAHEMLSFVPAYPLIFATGLHWAVSTTPDTLTLDADASAHVSASFVT